MVHKNLPSLIIVVILMQFSLPAYGMSGLGWFKERWPFKKSSSKVLPSVTVLEEGFTDEELCVGMDDQMPLLSDSNITINTESTTDVRSGNCCSIDTFILSGYRVGSLLSLGSSLYILVNGYDQSSWLVGLSLELLVVSSLGSLFNDGMVKCFQLLEKDE